ncbi:hypothetical protein AB0M95_40180 [Sphaerisporangium sp. NPDC051017]|uniref:hypothetical protein n=1 Tax=Sphaerisporangium sp. NPDC051017 TaxID=3154636 RepID=UPI0034319457
MVGKQRSENFSERLFPALKVETSLLVWLAERFGWELISSSSQPCPSYHAGWVAASRAPPGGTALSAFGIAAGSIPADHLH